MKKMMSTFQVRKPSPKLPYLRYRHYQLYIFNLMLQTEVITFESFRVFSSNFRENSRVNNSDSPEIIQWCSCIHTYVRVPTIRSICKIPLKLQTLFFFLIFRNSLQDHIVTTITLKVLYLKIPNFVSRANFWQGIQKCNQNVVMFAFNDIKLVRRPKRQKLT